MTPEIRQMIEILGDTLPPDVAAEDRQKVSEYLVEICRIADYRPSLMDAHIDEIIAHAKRREAEANSNA